LGSNSGWPSGARRWTAENAWLLALALIVPLVAGAIALFEHFDGLYSPDSFAYLDYATEPLRHAVAHLDLPPPFFWPPGYPYAAVFASFVVGRGALAAQLVSLVAAASVPVTTAVLARELWPARDDRGSRSVAPAVAGLLVAFSGQLWQSGVVVMSDALALALATAGAAALAHYGRSPRLLWPFAGAALLAAAVATRWVYALVALPCAAYFVLAALRNGRRAALHVVASIAVAGLVLGPVLVRVIQEDAFTGEFAVHHWSAAHIFQRHFTTADGTFTYRFPSGLYFALAPASFAYFTPLLAGLMVVGVVAVLRRLTFRRGLLLLAWPALIYLVLAGGAYQGFRFALPYLPPLAVLAGIGAERIAGAVARNRAASVAAATVLVAGLALMAVGGVRLTRDVISRKNDGLSVVRWTETNVPQDARLLTFTLTPTARHYSDLRPIELFEQTPPSLRKLLARDRTLYLLVDVRNIQTQWRDGPPGRNVAWLRRHADLTPLGTRAGFTLFRVDRRAP